MKITIIDPDDLPILKKDWEGEEVQEFIDYLTTNRKQNLVRVLCVPNMSRLDTERCRRD